MITGPNISSRENLVLSLDVANIKSFKGEPTTNLVTETPTQSGWAGTYSIVNSSEKIFDLTVSQVWIEPSSATWHSFYWDVSSYIGQYITISANYSFITEYRGNFSGLYYGQGSTGANPNYFPESPDSLYIITKIPQVLKWTGIINSVGIVGFTLYGNYVDITTGYVTCRVSNLQIEQKSYPTPFVNGTRGLTVATGGGLIDLTSYSNNGTIYNIPTYDSDFNGSLTFGGYNDIILLNSLSGGTLNPLYAITLSAWVYVSIAKSNNYIISNGWENGYSIALNSNNTVQFTIVNNWTPSYSGQTVTSTYPLTTRNWHHIVGVYNSSTLKLYIDGQYNNSANFSLSINQNSISTAIGGISHMTTSYPNNGIIGKISNVQIYNKALSASEVLQNYNSTKSRYIENIVTGGLVLNLDAGKMESYSGTGTLWRDLSGQGNNGTLTNGPTFNNVNSGSIVFDGVDDKVVINQKLTTPITICGFVKYIDASKTLNAFFNTYPHQGLCISLNRLGGGEIYIYIGNGTSWLAAPSIISSTKMTVNTWYQITFVSNGSGSILYLNDMNVGSSIHSPIGYGSYYIFGGIVQGGEYLKGNIGTVKIYNRALSTSEISQNYNALKHRYLSIQASGGTESTSNGYKIHKYTTSGTFTVTRPGFVEVLVVAGGGSGGSSQTSSGGGGGGGAGGLIYNSYYPVNSTLTVTVGLGGSGTTTSNQQGNNGYNSIFGNIIALGGGGGGRVFYTGNVGGSGGGAGYAGYGLLLGPAGTTNQGFKGGDVLYNATGAGGGGAGAAGGNTEDMTGHPGASGYGVYSMGGTGLTFSISGSAVVYATGGKGGGSGSAIDATPNTGNGSDGIYASTGTNSGRGGSGIVIIRYLT